MKKQTQFILDYYKQYSETIQNQTRVIDSTQSITFEALGGDMSYKRFFRVTFNHQTFILIVMPTEGDASIETFAEDYQLNLGPADSFITTAIELAHYLPHVSPVYSADKTAGLIVLQDHGHFLFEEYVTQHRNQPVLIISFFEKLFNWINQFQKLSEKMNKDFFGLQRIFEKRAQLIELEDYLKYGIEFVEKRFLTEKEYNDLQTYFLDFSHRIAQQPLMLIHRDFQSKNIMIEEQQFWVIDYQDLCYGPYTYDYASIIYDPYLNLETSLQEKLISLCWEMNFKHLISFESFRSDLKHCAIQRLLKAAGRYARFLALSGKDSHMKYYEPAVSKAEWLMTCFASVDA